MSLFSVIYLDYWVFALDGFFHNPHGTAIADIRQFVQRRESRIVLLDLRFIATMVLAVCARICFIFLNNAVLKIPSLKEGATTISAFVSAFSFVFIVLTNMLFLKERINFRQGVGAFVIIVGIIILTAEPKALK
jgi:drug/metabolite transporter (DMT)-like permease